MFFAAKAAFMRMSQDSDSEEEVGEEELMDELDPVAEEEEVKEVPVDPELKRKKANSIAVQLKTKKRVPNLDSDAPRKEEVKERISGVKAASVRYGGGGGGGGEKPIATKKALPRPALTKAADVRAAKPSKMKPMAAGKGKKWKQEVDTNVVEIPLTAISSETSISTGDPVFCQGCRVLLNSFSILQPQAEPGKFVWGCEFCGAINQVVLENEEIPHENKLKYIIESAGAIAEVRQGGNDTTTIIFCIDVSGSMCVTQPAKGNIKLKTKKDDEEMMRLQREFGEGEQFAPREARNRTYISRLECVQAAIESQLKDLLLASPERHVGLVTFNEEVTIYGDGRSEILLSGDRLSSIESCVSLVRDRHEQLMGRTLRETSEALIEKLFSLRESGQTALGPALLAAVELARQGAPGSKVIICTDGIANIGLGSLENPDLLIEAQQFYTQVGQLAQEKQVSVSVVSIEGEECQLSSLLPIVDLTGGAVSKVDPQHLAEDFSNILSAKLIGSSVNVTVSLHKALKFRNVEDQQTLEQKGSRMVKRLGNVTEADLFTFEYTFKTQSEREAEGVDVAALTHVPFQVRIEYTSLEGMKCVFTHTEVQPITTNKKEAMQQANFDILAKNGQVRSAALAQEGNYELAMANAVIWNKAMVKNSVSKGQRLASEKYVQESSSLYHALRSKTHEEEGEEEVPMEVRKMKRVSESKDVVTVASHKMKKKS